MAKGVFYLIDVEHEGDVQYAKSQIIDNGGTIDKVVWTGIEDDDAYIVFSAPNNKYKQLNQSYNMAKEITYRENLIILNSPDDVQAFILNEDGEIEDNTFDSLEEAKKWIDNNKRQDG